MQAIHDFLGQADEVLGEKGFGDEVFDAIHQRAQLFLDVGAAGHEQERNVARGFASAQLVEELPPIEAGHFVVAEDHVGGVVNHTEERIGAVRGNQNFAERVPGIW